MDERSEPASLEALKVRVIEGLSKPGMLRTEFAWVKRGPRRYKTATLIYFGHDAVTKQQLVLQAWERDSAQGWREYEQERTRWWCEDNEVNLLREFLNAQGELGGPGRYVVMEEQQSTFLQVLNMLGAGDRDDVVALLRGLTDSDAFLDLASKERLSDALIGGIEVRRQRSILANLKRAIADGASMEATFQAILANEWWIFGGRYIRCLDRRQLTVLDQVDLPLIRTDEALHLVELKRANVPRLIVPYRNHYSVGSEVNEAVNQVANYLRSFDEHRSSILADLAIECRRAFATVVIGSAKHVSTISQEDIRETVRTYNSHLSRIEVVTYDELVRSAENSIEFLSKRPRTHEGSF